MTISFPTMINWRCALGLALLLFGMSRTGIASAADTTTEHARLAAAVRQLDAIERLVAHQPDHPQDERSRYHFDYARLGVDLERVRAGIRDYLTPQRAQPRDPVELLDDYRQPAEAASEAATP